MLVRFLLFLVAVYLVAMLIRLVARVSGAVRPAGRGTPPTPRSEESGSGIRREDIVDANFTEIEDETPSGRPK